MLVGGVVVMTVLCSIWKYEGRNAGKLYCEESRKSDSVLRKPLVLP